MDDQTKRSMKHLVVRFDQMLMNVKGLEPVMTRLEAFACAGRIELQADPRNDMELGRGAYGEAGRKKLAALPMSREAFRLDVSPMDHDGVGLDPDEPNPIDFEALWQTVFPNDVLPSSWVDLTKRQRHCANDIMHIINAAEAGADVLLTRDTPMLEANGRLGLPLRIIEPETLVAELESEQHEE